MLIREMVPADIERGLFEVLSELSKVGDLNGHQAEKILKDRNLRGVKTYVAFDLGRVVGTASLLIEPKFIHQGGLVGHIEDVAVDRKLWGKGTGQDLVNHCIEQARQAGCYKVILNCAPSLTTFYEKCGFEVRNYQMRLDLK